MRGDKRTSSTRSTRSYRASCQCSGASYAPREGGARTRCAPGTGLSAGQANGPYHAAAAVKLEAPQHPAPAPRLPPAPVPVPPPSAAAVIAASP